MKQLTIILTVVGMSLAAIGIFGKRLHWFDKVKPEGAVKKMYKDAGGKKLYYAFKPSQLGKTIGVKAVPPFDGAVVSDSGVVTFSATEEDVKEFKARVQSMGEGWVIQEERIYSKDFSCSKMPMPSPGPAPAPGPLPPPGEWPEFTDRTDWGSRRTWADQAVKHVAGSSVTVCIVDTGADYNHEDLSNMMAPGGKSFVPGTTSAQDDEGHGSHVAGIIASEYNNYGMAGASQARIRPIKALDSDGSGASSWLMNAIIYAANSGCHVISNSWGSAYEYGPDAGITSAIQYAVSKGVYLAFAAGNDSGRTGWPAAHAPSSPLIYAVSASDQHDQITYFSSRGPEIEVMAPGMDIESVALGAGYVRMSGTSMATPYVAAALAMMIESGHTELGYDDTGAPASEQGKGRVNFLKSIGL